MENSIKERIRQRRAAMEMNFTSESGSFVSNFDKNDRSKNDEPSGRRNHAIENMVIDVSNEDVTNIQTLNSKESDEDDMLGRLKTRRIKWQNEFGQQGSWTQPSTPVQGILVYKDAEISGFHDRFIDPSGLL
ncbi:uncharacterized protein LOC124441787 [Xenia sp. Carnegie-2017]|uniref:uncharacterized protein LOC124441787 n=1 Tax=Xenia sp. Carnegie-2017 TaxID=2897299 RepID=UPI001F04FEEF|nr:uncharacterized protein LOC124441787 [Xenia sp. Carnegie-2017]